MPTQTQPWLRAELIAAPETMPGAQLMIPADGIEFHDDQLVFHQQGEVVYVAAQGQLRSITWFARQPNPETARRKARWPKHGTRWTDEERADLLARIRAGESWKTISLAHGRSRTGCQQEAVKQGWIHPDTLRPTPELLLGIVDQDAAAPAIDTTAAPATDPAPAPATEPAIVVPAATTESPVSTEPTESPVSTAEPVPPPHGPSSESAAPPSPTPALASAIAVPNPDRPRIPPRVPRPRTDSNPQPTIPKPGGDSEKEADPGSSPGSRLFSRAQSSLARATLGAYLNPPPGQSGAAT